MLLGRETHKKEALLLFTFIRVTAIHVRQQSLQEHHTDFDYLNFGSLEH